MSKHPSDERILHYQSKFKKIQIPGKAHRCFPGPTLISYSSDSGSDSNSDDAVEIIEQAPAENIATLQQAGAASPEIIGIADTAAVSPTAGTHTPTIARGSVPPLNSEILKALGVKTESDPEYGLPIHENLSQLWSPLLQRGLPKYEKETLNKKYNIPVNCKALQAPKLNLELVATIPDFACTCDKKILTEQQQLGKGITAVNRALYALFVQDENYVLETIRYLSDACRLLCDVHQKSTQTRIMLIKPHLERSLLNVIQDTQTDETLFGKNLLERIKASKTIEKQSQIKTTTTTNILTASISPTPQPLNITDSPASPQS